jgi:hypothetical protein
MGSGIGQTASLSLVSCLHRSLYVVLAATNEVHASGRIVITLGRADEPICAKETESLLPFAAGEEFF